MAFQVDRSRTIITAMIHGRRITAMDVAWLRREVFASGEVSREAADELFAVERAGLANAPEWTEFFVEMIVDHVVWQSGEPGVLGEAEAKWLSARVGECESANALAALAAALGEAHRAPPNCSPRRGRARLAGRRRRAQARAGGVRSSAVSLENRPCAPGRPPRRPDRRTISRMG